MARFRNLDGSGPHGAGAVFNWAVKDKLSGKRRRSPDSAPVPVVSPDLQRLIQPPSPGEPARATWIGHASWLIQLEGRSLLVDPVFGRVFPRIKRNVPPPFGASELPRIDAVLISHSHYDHLDLPSVKSARAPVIAGRGLSAVLGRAVPGCTELDWWQSTQLGELSITFVPSQHWSRRGAFDTNRTLWGGFVIEGPGARLYHSGDTAYFDGFSEIGRRFPSLDAAMLPIGAYDPAWFMETQHMNPEQAVQAYVDLGARTFLAMHWGTFKLTDEPLDEPPVRLRAEWQRRGLAESAIRICAIGESVEISKLDAKQA